MAIFSRKPSTPKATTPTRDQQAEVVRRTEITVEEEWLSVYLPSTAESDVPGDTAPGDIPQQNGLHQGSKTPGRLR
jgi:hypothetical protein